MQSDVAYCVVINPCEWNPVEQRAAYEHEVHGKAEFIIGARGKWRVCGKCAQDPHFAKFKKRKKIGETG